MSNYIQIKNQIEKLQKEAEILRKRERAGVIMKIKEAIAAFNLSAVDLGLKVASRQTFGRDAHAAVEVRSRADQEGRTGNARYGRKAVKKNTGAKGAFGLRVADKRSVVAPKYRDSASGATWTGRGKQPKWLVAAIKAGKKLEDFKI